MKQVVTLKKLFLETILKVQYNYFYFNFILNPSSQCNNIKLISNLKDLCTKIRFKNKRVLFQICTRIIT